MSKKVNQLTERTSPTTTDLLPITNSSGQMFYITAQELADYLSSISGGGGGGATPLSTPTLTATVISSAQIDLSWTNVANESSYTLEWSPNGTSGWTQIGGTIAANTTTYNHTSLTPSTAYYYRVRAIGDGVTYSNSGYGTDNDTTSAGGSGYETESDAYFAVNTGLTTPEKDAVDAFVASLKSIGWTKFKAVYLPVWGAAADNKWNLVDPEDNDASFRMTYPGTVTQGANFIKSDGSTGYGRTYLNPSTVLGNDNCGMSFFIKNAMLGGGNRAIGGCADSGLANIFGTFLDLTTATFSYAFDSGGGAEFVQEAFSGAPADRWISMSRTSATLLSQYINGGAAVTNTSTRIGTMPNQEVYCMAINNNGTADRFMFDTGDPAENCLQFFAIHEGLDSSASNNLRTAWNTLKTALSI